MVCGKSDNKAIYGVSNNCSLSGNYLTPIAGPTVSGAVDIRIPQGAAYGHLVKSNGEMFGWGDNQFGTAGVSSGSSSVCPMQLVNDPPSYTSHCPAKPSSDNYPQPCCVAVMEDERTVIGTNGDTVILTGFSQTYSNLNMAIFGTVILDASRTFNDCDVVMGKDAKIIVNSGKTLNIHTNSHFYACGDMWDGIVVNNNGRVYVQSGSIIEDAETAVDINYGALYTLNNATFNRNYTHVRKTMPPSGSPSLTADYRIVKCKFFCHTTPAGTTPANLLPPRSTQRTNVAIHAVDVPKILVGNTLANANTFDNTDFGIFTDGVSRVEVRFNTFRDIVYLGIGCLEGPGAGTETVAISRNTLQRMPTGIYCYDNPKATVKIDTNTITFAGMVSPPQVMTGIRVEEIVPGNSTYPNKLRIMGNDIEHAPSGIHLMNLFGNVWTSTTYIGENSITHTKIPNDAQAGILMQNMSGAVIKGNDVSNPDSTVNWWEAGIRCDGTTNMFFCNNTHHIGKGFFFDNDNRPFTMLVQDTMSHNETGIFLNYAVIGAQGSTAGDPNDNVWTTSTPWGPGNPHIMCYGSGSIGSLSPFHVQSGGTQYYPNHRAAGSAGTPVPTPTTAANSWKNGCFFSPPSYKTDEGNSATAEALFMVTESHAAEPETERERSIRWSGQFGLYRQLLTDEEFRYSNEGLHAYFLEKDGGNMGHLYRAMSEFNAFQGGSAEGLNPENINLTSSLTSAILPEKRLAEVLYILYANVSDPTAMDDATVARLQEIALLCPLDEGFGVYMARAALQRLDSLPQHYHSECEAIPAPEQHKQDLEQDVEHMFQAYPNPSNGIVQIDYVLGQGESGTLNVFTIVGQRLLQRQLDPSRTHLSLDLGNMYPGTYLLSVVVNGEQRLIQKINLIR